MDAPHFGEFGPSDVIVTLLVASTMCSSRRFVLLLVLDGMSVCLSLCVLFPSVLALFSVSSLGGG